MLRSARGPHCFLDSHSIASELFGVPGHDGDYLSSQPDWAGYQVSTKKGSGPTEKDNCPNSGQRSQTVAQCNSITIGTVRADFNPPQQY